MAVGGSVCVCQENQETGRIDEVEQRGITDVLIMIINRRWLMISFSELPEWIRKKYFFLICPGFVVSTLVPDKWQGVHVVDDVSLTLVPRPNITSYSLYIWSINKMANKIVSPDALAHLQWWPPAMVQLFSSSCWTCPLETVSAKAKMSTWTAAENKRKIVKQYLHCAHSVLWNIMRMMTDHVVYVLLDCVKM